MPNAHQIRKEYSHLEHFANSVKEEFGLANLVNHHFHRRAIVYICRQFNGMDAYAIRAIVRMKHQDVREDIQMALQYKHSANQRFMEVYTILLQRYIECTRSFLKIE